MTASRFFLMACLLLTLAACGKKPTHLDLPDGVDDDDAPSRVYPDPTTDPAPHK